jgi:hypothetical protein
MVLPYLIECQPNNGKCIRGSDLSQLPAVGWRLEVDCAEVDNGQSGE